MLQTSPWFNKDRRAQHNEMLDLAILFASRIPVDVFLMKLAPFLRLAVVYTEHESPTDPSVKFYTRYIIDGVYTHCDTVRGNTLVEHHSFHIETHNRHGPFLFKTEDGRVDVRDYPDSPTKHWRALLVMDSRFFWFEEDADDGTIGYSVTFQVRQPTAREARREPGESSIFYRERTRDGRTYFLDNPPYEVMEKFQKALRHRTRVLAMPGRGYARRCRGIKRGREEFLAATANSQSNGLQ